MRKMQRILTILLVVFLTVTPVAGAVFMPGITAEAASPSLSAKSLTIEVGKTKTLKVKNGRAQKWGTTNTSVVELKKKGTINTITVTAKKKGSCQIGCMLTNGKILYCKVTVKKASSSGSSSSSSASNGFNSADKKIYNKIIAMKKKYPDGSKFGDEKTYKGYSACQAFAYIMSDTAFGKSAPYYRHYDFGALRTGDIIYVVPGARLSDGSYTTTTHAMVVLKADYSKDQLVMCEGNYNGKAHWGGTYKISEFALVAGASVTSRYSYNASHSVKAAKPSGSMTISYSYSGGIGKFTFKKLSKNCTGYQVLFSEDSGFPYNHTQTIYTNTGYNYMQFHGTEHVWAQNASGGVAYMKVRAINNKGGYISYGKWSSVRTIR